MPLQTKQTKNTLKKGLGRTSLVIQWLRLCTSNAVGMGLIPDQELRSHLLCSTAKNKKKKKKKKKKLTKNGDRRDFASKLQKFFLKQFDFGYKKVYIPRPIWYCGSLSLRSNVAK